MIKAELCKIIQSGQNLTLVCLEQRLSAREKREERRERKGRAGATSLSQISVRVVCLCVPVFIIGPTVPKGAGNDICSDNLSCLLARSNSCHGL